MTNLKPRCCTRIYTGSFLTAQCRRPGSIERNGKFYCGTHDPEAEKRRQEKRRAKWEASWAEKEAARAAQEADRLFKEAAADAIRQIAAGHNNPRALAAEVVGKFDAATPASPAPGTQRPEPT